MREKLAIAPVTLTRLRSVVVVAQAHGRTPSLIVSD
jgi:hypothetical protein